MPKKELFTAEWFPYYFERFERSGRVAMLSLAEEGAYHRAIRHAWKFGSVPSDPEMLAALIQKRCSVPIAAKVLRHFEPMPGVPSQAIHPTVEEIRAEQERKFLSSRERGLAGAEARWGKKGVPSPEKTGVPSPESNGVPSPKTPKKPPKNGLAMAKPMQDLESESDLDSDLDSEFFDFSTDSYVRACVRDFSDADPRLVEIAVLESLIRRSTSSAAGKPIRKPAAYFREEIESMVINARKLGSNAVDVLLKRRRQMAANLAEGKCDRS